MSQELDIAPHRFIEIDENPVPSKGECFIITMPDDAKLRVASFPRENARGTVMLVHGRCEFIEKYFEVVNDLRERGFNVVTMDWRGQGLSSRLLPVSEKGHIQSFGTYVADLKYVMDRFVRPRFDGPYIAASHSMGGVPILELLQQGYPHFSAAILSAPMTGLFSSKFVHKAAHAYAQIVSSLGGERASVPGVKEHSLAFEGNILTHDPDRHARFLKLQEAAPAAALRSPTFGWTNQALAAIERIFSPGSFDKVKTPILIVSPTDDQLIDGSSHKRLAALSDKIKLVEVKDSFHEVMMETDNFRDQYWRAFDDFVKETLG